jgi:hypothetical protein
VTVDVVCVRVARAVVIQNVDQFSLLEGGIRLARFVVIDRAEAAAQAVQHNRREYIST